MARGGGTLELFHPFGLVWFTTAIGTLLLAASTYYEMSVGCTALTAIHRGYEPSPGTGVWLPVEKLARAQYVRKGVSEGARPSNSVGCCCCCC